MRRIENIIIHYLDDDGFIGDVEIGAHALGYNDRSIGICLIGQGEFSTKQIFSLHRLLSDLTRIYQIPADNIIGHCETVSGREQGKTCPNLDMKKTDRILKQAGVQKFEPLQKIVQRRNNV